MREIIKFSFSGEEDGSILVEVEFPEELEERNKMVDRISHAVYWTNLNTDDADEDMTEVQTNRVRSALESAGVKFKILDPYSIYI